jgi:cob(I)alamin adenosyltransferase
MSRVYTRLGDDGTTGLLFGGRVSKADGLIATLGAMDEVVATLGVARAAGPPGELGGLILDLQRELFVVAAGLWSECHQRPRLRGGQQDPDSPLLPAKLLG